MTVPKSMKFFCKSLVRLNGSQSTLVPFKPWCSETSAPYTMSAAGSEIKVSTAG